MHDWTLVSISVLWQEATVKVIFRDQSMSERELLVKDFTSVIIPKRDDWGKSVSVNEVLGPVPIKNGLSKVSIQIQSGDVIEIEAKTIVMPIG